MKPPVFNSAWPADILALRHHEMRESRDPNVPPQIWNQYHSRFEAYEGSRPMPLDILDAGCARGTLALRLAEPGHRVCAVDIRRRLLHYPAKRHARDSHALCAAVNGHRAVRAMSGQ